MEIKYELALFAGAGGGILGGILCGHTCIGAVEIEEYPRKVLLARQRDGLLPKFPIWDDVTTFRADNPECREYIEFLRSIKDELVITGGFPCQDISCAGKGAGITGERSGLWKEFARIIREIRPARVLVENSPMLTVRGLGVVLGDLASMGYDARWGVLGAEHTNLPHKRERIWVYGSNCNEINFKRSAKEKVFRFPGIQRESHNGVVKNESELRAILSPGLCRKYNGVDNQVDRLEAIGNGQVPAVVKLAWDILGD